MPRRSLLPVEHWFDQRRIVVTDAGAILTPIVDAFEARSCYLRAKQEWICGSPLF